MLAFQALPIPKVSVAWSEEAPLPGEQYIPAYKTPNGSELTLIYIGTSTCYACNVDYLPETIEQLKLLVQQKANAQGRTFVAQGISLDWGVKKGVEHLEKMGLFDEITAGRNWFNSGALKYIWQDIPGEAATPSLLVLERNMVSGEVGSALQNERLLIRKIGAGEIQKWLEAGAPLPVL